MAAQPSRRRFLEAAGVSVGVAALAGEAREATATAEGSKPKLAAITTVYHYLSHAYHIVGRFLDGFELYDGRGLHHPDFEIASLFIEQTPEATDLGRVKAKQFGVRLSPTIEDALTLGTGKLAVDGVLLIGEHGEYPYNEKLQKLYPRKRFFDEVVKVFKASGRGVPVFNDKHLSYDRAEARAMVDTAHSMKFGLMAGSSLPVTWRLPPLEVPLGRTWNEAVVASRGEIEIFGFHALESLQCMVERRDRQGKPQGVVAVTYLEGDAVWKAGDDGRWSWPLLKEALGRSHTQNPGDIRQNTRDFTPPPGRPTFLAKPMAFLVEYADGFKGSALILNGQVDDTTIAAKLFDGSVVATLFYLPAPPGARFFDPLVLRLEDFFKTGKPPYPVLRTQLTGGILDAALESRIQGGKRIETPDLATIDYEPPADSGFMRTPLARRNPNG